MVKLVAAPHAHRVYNATGPEAPLAMQALLEACVAVTRSAARVRWLDEALLAAQGIQPWKEMPLWVPESDPHASGFMDVPIARARGAGLRFRPLEDTIRDTLAWNATQPGERGWKAGLAEARERELLGATSTPPSPRPAHS
jgi:2'-hydroxyisoflavone reductase